MSRPIILAHVKAFHMAGSVKTRIQRLKLVWKMTRYTNNDDKVHLDG
jgi:hypothetical protein